MIVNSVTLTKRLNLAQSVGILCTRIFTLTEFHDDPLVPLYPCQKKIRNDEKTKLTNAFLKIIFQLIILIFEYTQLSVGIFISVCKVSCLKHNHFSIVNAKLNSVSTEKLEDMSLNLHNEMSNEIQCIGWVRRAIKTHTKCVLFLCLPLKRFHKIRQQERSALQLILRRLFYANNSLE